MSMRCVIVLLAAAVRMAGTAWGAPGDLDPTFGTGGTTTFASYPISLALSPVDGAIITASGGTVRRYTGGGVLDTSFGSGGETTVSQIRPHDNSGVFEQAVVDPSGGVLVAGPINPTNDALVVARLNTGGSLDSSFGTGGVVTVDLQSTAASESLLALALQGDGK